MNALRVGSLLFGLLYFGADAGELSRQQIDVINHQLEKIGYKNLLSADEQFKAIDSVQLEKRRIVQSIIKNGIIIEFDAKEKELVYFQKASYKVNGKEPDTGVRFSDADAIAASRKMAAVLLGDRITEKEMPRVSRREKKNDPVSMDRYVIAWDATFHGYASLDFQYVFVWYYNGTFCSISFEAPPVPPKPKILVDADAAKQRALDKMIWENLGPKYKVENPVLRAEEVRPLWVGPIPLLELPPHTYNFPMPQKKVRLAWIVPIEVTRGGNKFKAQVWIDCEDGEFVGGYMP